MVRMKWFIFYRIGVWDRAKVLVTIKLRKKITLFLTDGFLLFRISIIRTNEIGS